jgi:hypothetical protein
MLARVELKGDRMPVWGWALLAAGTLGLVALLMSAWWQRRELEARASATALPACTEKLGEEACREHLRLYGEDCARLNLHAGKRGGNYPQPAYVNQGEYLECVVLGVDEWVAQNGRSQNAPRDRAYLNP